MQAQIAHQISFYAILSKLFIKYCSPWLYSNHLISNSGIMNHLIC